VLASPSAKASENGVDLHQHAGDLSLDDAGVEQATHRGYVLGPAVILAVGTTVGVVADTAAPQPVAARGELPDELRLG
jgi:hypothetical protein